MRAASHPLNEERLDSLTGHHLLDTPPERAFDDITALLAEICEAPIALVSLVDRDRQWFKSHHGIESCETDLDRSICAHAILGREMVEIADTRLDPRSRDNPLNHEIGMRFYAGVPLVDGRGLPLGTLCLLDTRPRALTGPQRRALRTLADQVMAQLGLRRALIVQDLLTRETDHRVKNSLAQVMALLRIQEGQAPQPEVKTALAAARSRIAAIARVHAELFRAEQPGALRLNQFLDNLAADLRPGLPAHLELAVSGPEIDVPVAVATGLAVICNEFVTNSVKHGYPDGRRGLIRLDWQVAPEGQAGPRLRIELSDDGVGHLGGPLGLGSRVMQATAMQIDAISESRTRESGGLLLRLDLQRLHDRDHTAAA